MLSLMPPDCPGCGKLWAELPVGHWWRLVGYRYQCTGPRALYPEVTAIRKETT